MKKILISVFACGILASSFIQKKIASDPLEPCCTITSINQDKNMVTARNNTSGRLYQFTADALDMRSLKIGDAVSVNAQGTKVIAINGAARSYNLSEPDPIAPCCGIMNIQPDPAAPCCGVITAQNKTSGENFSFSVPKSIAASLMVGQKVSILHAGPVDGDKFGSIEGYAMLQSSTGALKAGTKASYAYPVKGAMAVNTTGTKNEAGGNEWEITSNGLRGAAGRVLVNLPSDLKVLIMFYDPNDKYLSSEDKSAAVSFPPGDYNINISGVKLKNVPVQKGMDTKIYAGILNVVTPSEWQVYDETKKQYFHGGSAPEKVGLPAGNYELLVNGIFQPVVIKNGEKTEF